MPKDRFGNYRDWAIGEKADGTIDSVPLSEWPKRAAEIAAYEVMWDQVWASSTATTTISQNSKN